MDCIGEEVFKKRRRLCIALAREIDNKNEKLLEMESIMKEKDILLKEGVSTTTSLLHYTTSSLHCTALELDFNELT